MTYRQTGPLEVRPNTLRDQRPPNTLHTRSSEASPGGPAGPAGLNRLRVGSGGARSKRTPRSGMVVRPGISPWPYVALALLAFVVVVFLINGAP
jgi:hypothetical protein